MMKVMMSTKVSMRIKALKMVADALAIGEAIPEKAVVSMSKLGIPRWMYICMGNRSWKKQAKQNMDVRRIGDQPFK